MRFPFSISFLVALCITAQAQNEALLEQPKDFAFNFSTSTDKKDGKNVTDSEFGYSRQLSDGSAAVFDQSVSGPNGFLKSDKIIFIDKNGVEMANLSSEFLADGKLKSQTLAVKDKPARTLNWYQTKTQSPDIDVPGSILRVNYSLQKGFFKQRIINLTLPDQSCRITTDYDEQGRRVYDNTKQKSGEMSVAYYYGPQGMQRLVSKDDKSAEEKEAQISYLKDGGLDGLAFKEGGVIQSRMKMLNNTDGSAQGQRIESYQNGIITGSMTTDIVSKIGIEDAYDATGSNVVERKGYSLGKEKTLLYEEQWSAGKVAQRTDYDLQGKKTSVTKYKADGTIESKEAFNSSASTVK